MTDSTPMADEPVATAAYICPATEAERAKARELHAQRCLPNCTDDAGDHISWLDWARRELAKEAKGV